MAWGEDENQPIDDKVFDPSRIKLSSAGLIYKYFGKEVLQKLLIEVWGDISGAYTESDIEKIYQKLYKNFFQEIDALDNGVKMAKDQNYHINTNLGTRVSRYNKAWNAPADVCQNEQFKKAMKVVEEELYW